MKIERLMSTRLITIDMDVSLKEIRELFEKASFHHLLVTEKDKLVGVISDRDILRWTSPFIGTPQERPADEHLLHKRAHQIMTRHPVTLYNTDSVAKALQLLVDKKLSCLPVTDADGSLVGIITARDFLQFMLKMVTNTL